VANQEIRGRKSRSGVQWQSLGRGPGRQSPQKLKFFCTFVHILKNGHRKCVFRYIDIVRNKMKKRSLRETQTLRAGCSNLVRRSQTFSPRHKLPSRGAGRQNFNQPEMATTFTYRPSLVKIDACNFELPWW